MGEIYIILGERVGSNITSTTSTTTTTTTMVVRTAPPPTATTTAQSGVYTPTAGDADPFPGIRGRCALKCSKVGRRILTAFAYLYRNAKPIYTHFEK